MAKYVSLENLELYDEKIKAKMAADDASMLASAQADAKTKADAVQGKLDEEVTRAKAREDEIAGLVATAQNEVDALEGKVGEVPTDKTVMGIITEIQQSAYDDTEVRGLISGLDTNKADKTQVATDIETAVNAEKTAREQAVAGVQGEVDALEQIHATDKADLEGKIALKADQTTVDGMNTTLNAVKEDVDAFFLDADMTASAKDTLKELQQYIAEDESGASQMVASIKQNADDIDALEGRMGTVEGAVATKVEQSAYDTKVAALEGADTGLGNRITALEGKFGGADGSVEAMIATAKQQAIDVAAADAKTKADTAEQNAMDYASDLNDSMDAKVDGIDVRVQALEAAMPNKAEVTDLNNAVGRIAQNETDIDALQAAVQDIVPLTTEEIENLF